MFNSYRVVQESESECPLSLSDITVTYNKQITWHIVKKILYIGKLFPLLDRHANHIIY